MITALRNTWWTWPLLCTLLLLSLWVIIPPLARVDPVYLWTDRLIFVLLTVVLFVIAYIRQWEHLRTPWRQVFQRKLAMASLIILCAYLTIGLLDSVHYRKALTTQSGQQETHYSGEVLSLFDYIVGELRTQDEKTFSAPFAVYQFSKEIMESPNGKIIRGYPRLKYAAAHLQDPEREQFEDILITVLQALAMGLFVWGAVCGLVIFLLAGRTQATFGTLLQNIIKGHTTIPWHVILTTIGVMIVLVSMAILLSNNYHIFGTDKVGQDVFYLTLKSIRTGLVIGTLTTLIMLPFALMLGIFAGYFRGWIDDIIQYLYTTLSSIPSVLLIAAAILTTQVYIDIHPEWFDTTIDRADIRLLCLCAILGITSWTGLCRLLRGETLKLREVDYIEAAKAFGVSHFRIVMRHILPNVMHIVLIIVVLDFSGLVLAEAVLSYVGVGVDSTTQSWGNMINSARLELAREPMVWWSLVAAFIFMFALVLAANLFSDALRDAFDPRTGKIS